MVGLIYGSLRDDPTFDDFTAEIAHSRRHLRLMNRSHGVYVLDTDHLSLHLRGHQQVRERLALVAFDSSP